MLHPDVDIHLTYIYLFRYEMGIQTFDTANLYSNGMSEIILGKAIKQLELPREDIVVITKVHLLASYSSQVSNQRWTAQLSGMVGQSSDRPPSPSDEQVALDNGYVHKFGSTRKVRFTLFPMKPLLTKSNSNSIYLSL